MSKEGAEEPISGEFSSSVDDLEEFESAPSVDFSQFIGKKVPIERIVKDRIKSKYGVGGVILTPGNEIMAPIVRFETAVITTLKNGKGEDIEVRASEIFSLKEKDGKIGWGEKSDLKKFLNKMKANHPKAVLGKLVIITTRPGKQEGQEFLGFIKE